jgi:hypothetical protein
VQPLNFSLSQSYDTSIFTTPNTFAAAAIKRSINQRSIPGEMARDPRQQENPEKTNQSAVTLLSLSAVE